MKSALLVTFLLALSSFCYSQRTYYGYGKAESTSSQNNRNTQVNWAEVGSDFRNAIDEASRKRAAQLNELGWASEREYHDYMKSYRKEKRALRKKERINKKRNKKR
jgi:hypothetical protein